MAAVTTVVDGNIKFREGKKWKNRWCVFKKPSPVADHLQLVLYKDVSEACKPNGKAKAMYPVDSFFGLEAEICVDREQHVLAIICLKSVFLLAFELRESMIRFEIKIRQSLGEENQFPVKVVKAPSSCKLPKEQLSLIIHDTRFCLAGQTPPKVFLSWNVEDLRRFVARDDKFIFEAGTRCGKGSGHFAILSEQANDIADIMNLASSGKMSNCHRKFKNRRSQIELGSHLISPLPSQSPSSSQAHHYLNNSQQVDLVSKAPLQTALPATLNCCHQNQTGSAESEDWSWYKRHSVSVTDHRRISAHRDKNAVDNRDQMMMPGIYDIPPNHEGETGATQEPLYDHPRSFLSTDFLPSSSPSSGVVPLTSDYVNNDDAYTNIDVRGKDGLEDPSRNESGLNLENASCMDQTTHSKLVAATCDATLERLKKQEDDLQREMVLLDEMLQSCTTEDRFVETAGCSSQNTGHVKAKSIPVSSYDTRDPLSVVKEKNVDASFGLYDELPLSQLSCNKENVAETSTSLKHLPMSSFSPSHKDFEIISGNVSIMKPNLMTQSGIVEKRLKSVSDRLNTSMPEGTPLSPLFHAKLNSIPPSSRLNAPLPYVNLSGYDDDGTNHVHLPGSADCLPAVTRGSSFHNLNASHSGSAGERPTPYRGHTGSSTSLHLPTSVSSLTNLNQYHHHLDSSPRRLQGRQSLDSATGRLRVHNHNAVDHFKLKQAIEGPSFANAAALPNQREVLVVRMDSTSDISSNNIDSAVQPSGKFSLDARDDLRGSKSDIVGLLMVDSGNTTTEDIYVNLPAVKENSPPPPPLPPKGPALLKKLQSTPSSSSLEPTPQIQTRSAIGQCQDRHYGYDNEPLLTSTLSQRKEPAGEPNSNYFEMGSPKPGPKFRADTVPKVMSRHPDAVPKLHKTMAKIPKGRDDYMDMGVADLPPTSQDLKYEEDDEIYLDADETFKNSDLYISERKRAENNEEYVPVRGLPERRESTYIEMAQVIPPRHKSTTVQNLETLQAYVSQKIGGSESASSTNISNQAVRVVNPIASPSHPPLPRSFKVRHNSDSGPPKRSSVNLDNLLNTNTSSAVSVKPGKSPMKIYTRIKASSEQPRSPSPSSADPPAPFTNLKEFTKRMGDGKSTYVNTTVNGDDILVPHDFVPLPEPVTKESFLARLKRRGSRDKGTPDKSNNSSGGGSIKNKSAVLERTLSEHESPKLRRDEKNSSLSKLKIGRRRSSSFPNRLSYHESNSESSLIPESSQVATETSTSPSVSSVLNKLNPLWKKDQSHSESSSSVQDYSDDSDKSPLLRHGKPNVVNSITVLRVQQSSTSNYTESPHTQSSNSPSMSKTDDEKMIEIYQRHHHPTHHHSKSLPEASQDNIYLNCNYKKTSNDIEGLNADCCKPPLGCYDDRPCNGKVQTSLTKIGPSTEEYCNMPPVPPPRPPSTLSVNVGVSTQSSNDPPALPPKTKNYQVLLSPVYETPPPLPVTVNQTFDTSYDDASYLNISSATWRSERDVEEDSLSDQYVELKGVDDVQTWEEEEATQMLAQINPTSVDSKAGRESIPSTSSSNSQEMNSAPAEYTTISIPIALNYINDDIDADDGDRCEAALPPSPRSSSILDPNNITVERNSISSDGNLDCANSDCCINPAKSILRPRTGGEYIVIKRIPQPDTASLVSGPPSESVVSESLSLSQVFEDLFPHRRHYCKSHHHHHSQNHHHQHRIHQHHPVSSCTSLSACSQRNTPQRSPSFSSTIGTSQSQNSLFHDPWERDPSFIHPNYFSTPQNTSQKTIVPTAHNISITTHSTPSPSPKPLSRLYSQQHLHHTSSSSPKTKKNSSGPQRSTISEDDNIFFPIDMTYNASSPLPTPVRRHGTSGSDISHHQPIYVNQQFVDIHYSQSQSSGSRTNSTCSSQYTSSPHRSFMQAHRSLLQDSFPSYSHSKQSSDSNSLGRKSRNRSRHSESDAGFGIHRLSKSFTLPSNHYHHRPSLTLPVIHVQRSHSDSKKADHLQPRHSISQSHILGKEFDKFANSSIIARRRLKHAPTVIDSVVKGERESPPPIASRLVNTSDSSPNLQIPSTNLRSSGYKNIDRFGSTPSNPSSNNVSPAYHGADGLSESQLLSSDQQNDSHAIANSPPPLPMRQRLVSTPSTISPPLTPFMGASSDISDSPPPYNAPPPPDFHRSEPYLTPTSSEDEQELNYIEIDMTTRPCQVEEPPVALPFSRRSKRARQQRKLAKLRYAEIDHTATKALQHTGQEHAQSRRSSNLSKSGSSLSRMNSAPISKNHKPLTIRERKHSTGSVESF